MKVPAMCEIDFFLDMFVSGLSLYILCSSNQPEKLHKTGKSQFFFPPLYVEGEMLTLLVVLHHK